VNRREKCMNDSVKVFVSDGRKDLKTDAVKFKLPWRDVVSAAIDSNLMSARNKTSSEVLCEGLKTSVAGWNASSSQYRDPHCFFEACFGLQELQNLLTMNYQGLKRRAFRPFSASRNGVLDLTDRTSDNLVIQAGNRSEISSQITRPH